MSQKVLVGISGACRILKVSETALRQWTDEGQIKAFVTPGGHRRYLVTDLKKFISPHQKTLGIRDLVVELEDAEKPLRDIARVLLPAKAWYNKLGKDSQQALSRLGHNMLQGIIKYVSEPSHRDDTMMTVRDIGRDFGETLAKLGLSLTDSVEAFILHRDPIMNAAIHLIKGKGAFTGRIVDAIPLVAHVMDETLVSLVAGHQQYRNGTKKDTREETS